MTHRFFVQPDQIGDPEVTFTPMQVHQLRNVLRMRQGDQVRVFDGIRSCDLLVELDSASRGRIVGEVTQASEPRTYLSAYPALLQREKFETVLQKLTELGVGTITPVLTARGLVREPPDDRRYARWRAIILEAAQQCGRGRVPRLDPVQPLAQALRSAEGTCVLAYEAERDRELREALGGRPEHVSIFVGPEGGFTFEEIECAREHGAHVITLGPRVLRTETASPVLAALVLYELGDLSWPGNAAEKTA